MYVKENTMQVKEAYFTSKRVYIYVAMYKKV